MYNRNLGEKAKSYEFGNGYSTDSRGRDYSRHGLLRYLRDYSEGDKTFGTVQHAFKSRIVVDSEACDTTVQPPPPTPVSFARRATFDAVAHRIFYFNAAHGICAHLSAANGYGV